MPPGRPLILTVAVAVAVAVAVGAAAIGGCGGASVPASTSTSTTSARPATPAVPPPRIASPRRPRERRPAAAPVGRPQDVHAGGSALSVTVTAIHDPLRDSGAAVVPGTHAVGVQVTIANQAGATYNSTASGDWSLDTSRGPAAPLFIRQGVCQTPDADFESLISPGEVRSGCVGFAAPNGSRVLAVRFSPHAHPPGTVTWR